MRPIDKLVLRRCAFCGEFTAHKVRFVGFTYYVCRNQECMNLYRFAKTLYGILRENGGVINMLELLKILCLKVDKSNMREWSQASRRVCAVVRIFKKVFKTEGREIKLSIKATRYSNHKWCSHCKNWVSKDYGFCPYCGYKQLREKPKAKRLRIKYNSNKKYDFRDAVDMYYVFLERGYSQEEAVDFVESITGFRLVPLREESMVIQESGR